ncbi:hypothetical protein EVJ58_g11191 [Rhodofomes roseus]|uniref:F-box domain-containing protein n=1 Tax=Rhodofomes roseus TaxID=34475 RepID=A0A4Y9XKB9_9APHY|nr:hypothetical protein EVJ58_g11191 [Rhodofomes roseus]
MNIDVETRWTERLPPEVWQIVLHFTSSETIRDCLGVSRLFHDIAARKIFSSLRIRFGSLEVAYELTDKPPEDNECRTCCVLLRILTDTVFASYVKHLDILAFADKLAPFEMCSLTKAIGTMYNLRTFRWHTVSGTFTMPSNELLGTLASTCGRLRGCSLPIQCLDALVTDAVERIKSAYTTTYKMVFKNRDPHVFCART